MGLSEDDFHRVRTPHQGADRQSVLLSIVRFSAEAVSCAAYSWKSIFTKALTRPFMLFACQPIIQLLGLYMAFVYVSYSNLSIPCPPTNCMIYLS